MVKRKFWLCIVVFAVFFVFAPKKAYAGTCTCTISNDRSVSFVSSNCDAATEDPQCETLNNWKMENGGCDCVKKADSGLPANTCTCYADGSSKSNCQGGTPHAVCEQRSGVCVCSKDGTLNGVATPIPTSATSNSTDPFCSDGKSINTALGCIPVGTNDFIKWLLPIIFGIAGGISFLLMVYGFILMATSSGDEKKLQGAKETISSAIVGLLVSIFAIFIFKLIAVNILQIPGIN
jgi:hypothetical protein